MFPLFSLIFYSLNSVFYISETIKTLCCSFLLTQWRWRLLWVSSLNLSLLPSLQVPIMWSNIIWIHTHAQLVCRQQCVHASTVYTVCEYSVKLTHKTTPSQKLIVCLSLNLLQVSIVKRLWMRKAVRELHYKTTFDLLQLRPKKIHILCWAGLTRQMTLCVKHVAWLICSGKNSLEMGLLKEFQI